MEANLRLMRQKKLSLKNISKRLIDLNEKLEAYLAEFKKSDLLDDITEEFTGTYDDDKINKAHVDKIADLQKKLERLELQKQQLEKSGKNYLHPMIMLQV
jgi:hypothetical protein